MAINIAGAQTSNPFYDKPSTEAQTEIESWGKMFVEKAETGAAAAGAGGFAYSMASMNSPLFSPVSAAMRVVNFAKNGLTIATDCTATAVVTVADKVLQLEESKISTELTGDVEELVTHLEAIAGDPAAAVLIEGNALISVGLAVPVETSVPGTKSYANASTETLTWIAALTGFSQQHAAGLDQTDDAKRRLTGEARGVDLLEAAIEEWARQNGVSLGTYQVEALFGAYGALPVIVAAYGWGDGSAGPEHGFLLIDGVTGEVDGPFVSGTAINPVMLLEGHSAVYVAGTGSMVVRAGTGTCATMADTRTPYTPAPGPFTVPPGLIPIAPAPGSPLLPGKPEPWKCTTTTAPTLPYPGEPVSPSNPTMPAGCVCRTTWHYQPGGAAPAPCPPGHIFPGPCDIKYEVICYVTTPGTIVSCNGGPNTVPAPTPPATPPISTPTTPPVVPATPGITCIENWWYWS